MDIRIKKGVIPRAKAMDLFKAIYDRRSIRQFTTQRVEDCMIEDIIAAGMMAPSAGNEQPWHFVVIRERKTLAALSKAHLYASLVAKAPVAILVCGDGSRGRYEGFWIQDCAAATQNMLLAAHGLGLGSFWIGIYPRKQRIADIRSVIPLPDSIKPFSLLPVGYPGEVKERARRFDRGRIHLEKW